ncbi:hypothetical protein C8J57DRAFT_1143218, partial [Mycena rebaudengoi]
MEEVADLAHVSLGLVSKTVNLYLEYGQVNNPFSNRTGRPRTLNEGDTKYIEEILRTDPTLYLDEIQAKLQSLSRKKLTKAAAERDEQLRTIWEAEMAQYPDPNVFVALDESAVDNKTV